MSTIGTFATRPPRPTFPIEDLRGTLPDASIGEADHASIAASAVAGLAGLRADKLSEESIWRDLLALTGTLRTLTGRESILSNWQISSGIKKPHSFQFKAGSSSIVRFGDSHSWIQAQFSFMVEGPPESLCSGFVGLVPDGQSWKIWLLTTMVEHLNHFPSPDRLPCPSSSPSRRSKNVEDLASSYPCVIVGAGFSGLCLAGRLEAMGIECLVIEGNAQVGDNWLHRYESVKYHTSKYFSDFPVEQIFSGDYPYFLTGKELARGFQEYVKRRNLNVCLATKLISGSLDKASTTWTLNLNRAGLPVSIKASHVVLATGIGNRTPTYPKMSNKGAFKGLIVHSGDYKTSLAWKGKKAVVVGSANTAHDVASDMLEAGLSSVTMVQRGRTPVFPIEHYQKWSNTLYYETCDLEKSDREVLAIPLAIARKKALLAAKATIDNDHERFDALESRGFRVERYVDLWKCLSERNGGHYQDVGCSAKIAAGLIQIKSDAKLTGYHQSGLSFNDGSKLNADVVVFCTGYENDIRAEASRLFGTEIANELDDLWGIDEEGELRGVYKPTACPGLWFHGGGVLHTRFYSRFLALQIQAQQLGTPFRVDKQRAYDGKF